MKTLTFLFICICLTIPCAAINDPIAHWKFDEGSGAIAYDSIGDNHGDIYGAEWTTGQVGGALYFNGVDDDYVWLPDGIINTAEAFSVFMWIRLDNKEGSHSQMIFRQDRPPGNGVKLLERYSSNDKLASFLGFEYTYSTQSVFQNTSQWHHVGLTHIEGFLKLYIDGQEDGSNTVSVGSFTSGFRVGGARDPSTSYGSWDGVIDEIVMYDRAISAEEVEELYQAGSGEPSGPIAHWKLDETSGDTAYDSAGSNDGTLVGDPVWTNGQIDGALEFDGSGDYVNIIESPILDISGDEITIAAWINTNSISYRQVIAAKNAHGNNSWLFEINPVYFSDGTINFFLEAGGSKSNLGSNIKITTGSWYHVTAVYNGIEKIIYINGQYDIEQADSGNLSLNNEAVRIGAWGNLSGSYGGPRYFDGKIDDVRIYDRALSDEEVEELAGMVTAEWSVAVDIKPGACPNPVNVKSKGILPVAILGTEEFDVSTIDPASVFLNGVPAIRSSYEDVGGPVANPDECECTTEADDGFGDLSLKFETEDIVESLGEVNTDDILTLILTGVLNDETSIEGADCVVIVGRHKPINEADINEDGLVNTVDIAIVAENWLESSIVEE